MSKFLLFIGSDISKAVIDIAYHQDGIATYLGQFPNSIFGYTNFVKQLLRITSIPSNQWFLCFENTGVYSKSFLTWLLENNIPCREENALKISRSLGLKRGKDDKVDSLDVCQYAFEKEIR